MGSKDFEPIKENGDKAKATDCSGLPKHAARVSSTQPCDEFRVLHGDPGKVPDTSDYQSIFGTLDAKSANNAMIVIVHDSCHPTESLPNLVHPDTLSISMPRATLLEKANTMDSIKTQVDCDQSPLLLGGEWISSQRSFLR